MAICRLMYRKLYLKLKKKVFKYRGCLLYLAASVRPVWLLVLFPVFVGQGFGWTCDVGGGGSGGDDRRCLAVCQGGHQCAP